MKKIIFKQHAIEAISGINVICIDANECVANDGDAKRVYDIYDKLDMLGDIIIEDMTEDEFNALPDFIKNQIAE